MRIERGEGEGVRSDAQATQGKSSEKGIEGEKERGAGRGGGKE